MVTDGEIQCIIVCHEYFMISVSKNPATDPTHEGNTERLSGHDGQLCALLES